LTYKRTFGRLKSFSGYLAFIIFLDNEFFFEEFHWKEMYTYEREVLPVLAKVKSIFKSLIF